MRRTLERRHFSASGVARGEVVVASTFEHPVRGLVSCPAAPVAYTGMLVSDLPVRYRPVGTGAGDAVLHAVSYVGPDGRAVGLGVAAHRDDRRAVRLAEEVVREWSEVMRTRRVMLDGAGPSCAGVRREAALFDRLAGPTYVLTDGHQVPQRRPWREVRPVERMADVPEGATVVLPAHGTTAQTAAEVRSAAESRDIRVVDATCPLVARAHATARRFADENAAVAVIGGAGHAAVPPLAAQAPGSVVVTSVEEVDELVAAQPPHVAFVVSPGIPVEDASRLAARLRSRFPGAIGQHPDEFCYAASDRLAAVRTVASSSDLTLVLGSDESVDTRALVAAATQAGGAVGGTVEQLDDLGRLRPDWLRPVTSVGILVGASAPPDLAGDLIEVLSGLGPLSVTRRSVATEVVSPVPMSTNARRAG